MKKAWTAEGFLQPVSGARGRRACVRTCARASGRVGVRQCAGVHMCVPAFTEHVRLYALLRTCAFVHS